MKVITPEKIASDISATEARRFALQSEIEGKLAAFDLSQSEAARIRLPVYWVLLAQKGSLEKLELLIKSSSILSAGNLGLLAIARNLFENLIWLRLFKIDLGYGLVFYAQLLQQQGQNLRKLIAKIESEIVLFEDFEKADKLSFDELARSVREGLPAEAAQELFSEKLHALNDDLDNKARRAFSLYAHQAKFNSYSYQVYLLQTEEIPRLSGQLKEVENRIADFEAHKRSLFSPEMLKKAGRKWEWRSRSIEVGMVDQYDFLYSYTSKLLHSTPLNIVSDKSLSESEIIVMMDYIYVAALDMMDVIASTEAPGPEGIYVINYR